MNKLRNDRVLNEFKHFLELQIFPFGIDLKVLTNKKKKIKVFTARQNGQAVARIPVAIKDLEDPKVTNLNITLQIGEGAEKEQNILSNAASAIMAYLKLYKDILDTKNATQKTKITKQDLNYYESYFKLLRQKWLGETKN